MPKRRNTAPTRRRAWSLSHWPVRTKIAAALALPVLVAATLAAARVQTQLADAARFTSTADHVGVLPAAVDLGAAVDALGATRIAGTDPAASARGVDDAAHRLADQIADLGRATGPLGDAIASARMLTDRLSSDAHTADIADRVDTINATLQRGVADAVPTAGSEYLSRLSDRFVDAWDARRAFASQRILSAGTDRGPHSQTRLVFSAGVEATALGELATGEPASSPIDTTLRANRARLDALSNGADIDTLADTFTAGEASYRQIMADATAALRQGITDRATESSTSALRDTAIVIAALLGALTVALLIAQSLVIPIRRLRDGALRAARHDLPKMIARIRAADPDTRLPAPVRLAHNTGEELGELGEAIDDLHRQAIKLAGEQATIRRQVNDMFETLSRRNKALIDQQLGLIEALERDEENPARLRSLFRLDHLVTRMRRNGNNLLVLAGTTARRNRTGPVTMTEVIQAAISEVEEYRRVAPNGELDVTVAGAIAPDLAHILAELLDNALRFSPPDSPVRLTLASAIDGGVLIDIADAGLGMAPDEIAEINRDLVTGGSISADTARRMGLFVVGRLAHRHDIAVRLRPTRGVGDRTGITVGVHVPAAALVESAPRPGPEIGAAIVSRRTPQPAPSPVAIAATASARVADPPGPATAARHPGARLPKRRPGANGFPVSSPEAVPTNSTEPPPPRHHREPRPRAAATTAFFTARLSDTVAPQQDSDNEPTPIYQRLVSEWLADPNVPPEVRSTRWSSASADAGWDAARQAASHPVERTTAAGLPIRQPGARLIPGSAAADDAPSTRDPERIRAGLTGLRSGIERAREQTGATTDDPRETR